VARRQGDELGSTVEEKRVGADQKSIRPVLHQAGKGDIDLATGTGANDVQFPADGRSRRLRLRNLGLYNPTVRIDEHGKARCSRQQFVQKSESFCGKLHVQVGDASDVAARAD